MCLEKKLGFEKFEISYANTTDEKGNSVSNIPKQVINVSLFSKVTDKLSINGELQSVSELTGVKSDGSGVVPLKDYNLLNAKLSYLLNGNSKIYLNGENLNNDESINKTLLSDIDLVVTATGNFNVCDKHILNNLKSGAIVSNIGHFDNEIDTQYMRDEWTWEEIKPQVHKIYRDPKDKKDYLLLLAEGRLVNLGNATGHPSRIMDGSFANQVLAQIFLYKQGFASINDETTKQEMLKVQVLPMELDEEVASYMVEGFGGVITKLTKDQADYINVDVDGPYKPDYYKY